ncbi:hypothetical protein [Lutispora saccharofermentans]|uniref:Lipoprotein n=1 Tax=Lutispora saccharofermentans TaxID=3024236 RepID=A0ABT1NLD2_9FIRM|nr:hypothetical protein [Lutispora saccharofermentans]MCQ1531096.1 hypothetical protein [Lutispora saccharofermentans]
MKKIKVSVVTILLVISIGLLTNCLGSYKNNYVMKATFVKQELFSKSWIASDEIPDPKCSIISVI